MTFASPREDEHLHGIRDEPIQFLLYVSHYGYTGPAESYWQCSAASDETTEKSAVELMAFSTIR